MLQARHFLFRVVTRGPGRQHRREGEHDLVIIISESRHVTPDRPIIVIVKIYQAHVERSPGQRDQVARDGQDDLGFVLLIARPMWPP